MESNIRKVFVNGTFDVLHLGHLKLLNYAKSKGDYLFVAIDTDSRVQMLKGTTRPINTYEDRRDFLLALGMVNRVTSFNSDEGLRNIVKEYQPDLMVVGSDWRSEYVLGSEHARTLEFFDRIEPYSTTRIVNR